MTDIVYKPVTCKKTTAQDLLEFASALGKESLVRGTKITRETKIVELIREYNNQWMDK